MSIVKDNLELSFLFLMFHIANDKKSILRKFLSYFLADDSGHPFELAFYCDSQEPDSHRRSHTEP